jgi:O-antigen/teichoic acid export membrane protein
MANLRRSLVINFFSSSGAALLQFIVSVILARILSPSEIGLFSMTVVFVNFAHVFRDFGVTTYLQREPDLTHEKIRSAIGVVFTSSWIIAVLLFLASGWVGRWFNEPGIIPIMRVLSIGFLIIPFGAITSALLAREFAAEKQAVVNAVGTTSFCASCLLFGYLGYGSMSLAYANLVNIIACALVYIPMRPKGLPWLPAFHHWRSVVHFGGGLLLSNCITTVNNAVPDILLGKLGSARHVGLLSRANSTVTIFTYVAGSTVSYGAMTYMAQAHHRGESLSPIFLRATSLLTGVGWAALALTAILGHDIVMALYGLKWLEAVPAILPLSLSAAVGMMFHYVWTGVTAIGKPYLAGLPSIVTLVARVAFGILFFDGSLVQFAWALCFATICTAPVIAMQQRHYFGLTATQMLRGLVPSAIVALGSAVAAALLAWVLPPTLPALTRLLLMAAPLAVVWYFLLRATRHELVDELHQLAGPLRTRLALLLQ